MSPNSRTLPVAVELNAQDYGILDQIGRLRVSAWAAFLPHLTKVSDSWLDHHDHEARHWAVFNAGKIIAAARLSIHASVEDVPDAEVYNGIFETPPVPPVAALSRLVVDPAYRGTGISDALDDVRIAAAEAMGAKSIVVATPSGPARLAQLPAKGFSAVGPPQDEPKGHILEGLKTQPMIRLIAQSSIQAVANKMGWGSDASNPVTAAFIEFVGGTSRNVLDIGAGFGVATIRALEAGASVIANDIDSRHLNEILNRTPTHLHSRLTLLKGRFPHDINFDDAAFDAIHASQVFHYLRPEEIEVGLSLILKWLRPGGRLFILTATPYQASHARFIPIYEQRKSKGIRWPGVIDNYRDYCSHWSADHNPGWLHVLDDHVLSSRVAAAGFHVDWASMFRRPNLPDFCALDGRENLGLIATRP